MSWRHRTITLALLAILAGLPAVGTACALLCESGVPASAHDAKSPSHHGSSTTGKQTDHTGKNDCQEPATSSDVQLRAAAGHECGSHEGTVRQAASFAANRADGGLRSAPAAVSLTDPVFIASSDGDAPPGRNRRPGTAPPASTPLVLRL